MKSFKLIFALLAISAFVFTSCTSNSTAEDESLYDQQSIKKMEIKDSDV